ncbi:MAG: alanine racemase [Peptoniphilaceae bacterium]|nr:alanine racemase [Peptoniphilaceae bacterium]MDY3738594.1 alanine racemase [Peptoniphilaceae bacterium]
MEIFGDTYLKVDLDKIRKNIVNLKKFSKNSKFCLVAKADAYGLGDGVVAKEVEDLVDYFAVSRVDEGILLRKNNIKKPIFVLGYVDIQELTGCEKFDIGITIYDYDYAKKINENLNKKLNCHIAIDSGHGRIGFRNFEIDKILKLKNLEKLDCVGIFSHFATADEDDITYTKYQYDYFLDVVDKVKDNFPKIITHISNDAGLIKHKILCDMVRCGISVYGIYPSDVLRKENEIELFEAFELKSTISFVKEIYKGDYISYGRTFRAEKKMKVATVSIGYADGYSRSFSNLGEMSLNGHKCRVLGRVCMDQLMIDVTGLDAKIGDKVSVYPDIYEEAEKIGTIVYELMTNISKRVPRIYYKDEKVCKRVNYNLQIENE